MSNVKIISASAIPDPVALRRSPSITITVVTYAWSRTVPTVRFTFCFCVVTFVNGSD